MPGHLVLEPLQFTRGLDQANGSALCKLERQPLRHGENHVALRNAKKCGGKEWNDQAYVPLQRKVSQGPVDRCLLSGQDIHYDMPMLEVLAEGKSSRSDGMIGSNDTYEIIGKQNFRLEPCGRFRHIQNQIESSRCDVVESAVMPGHDLQ